MEYSSMRQLGWDEEMKNGNGRMMFLLTVHCISILISNPSSSLLCQFPSIPLYLFLDHSNQSNLVLNPSYLMSIIALTHTILYHYTPYSSPLHSLQNEWFCSLFLLIVAGFRKV